MQRNLAPNRPTQTSDSLISVRDFFYISNLLSMMRIGLIPLIFYSIIYRYQLATLAIGGLIILSDALDGYFARRLNQHTNLGKILDPIADKAAIGAVILALILFGRDFPLWAFGIVIIRDILIVFANIVLFRRTQIIARSDRWGKSTTFFLSTALILYVLEDQIAILSSLPLYILCVSLVFSLVSIWRYSRRLFHILQQNEPHQKKST